MVTEQYFPPDAGGTSITVPSDEGGTTVVGRNPIFDGADVWLWEDGTAILWEEGGKIVLE